MRVVIQPVQQKEQRYETIGDYFVDDGVLQIRVTKQRDWRYEFLIALHELIEEATTRNLGIKEEDILAFDVGPVGGKSDDPGSMTEAPYHKQHVFAENVERLVAAELGVDWEEYSKI